MKIEIPPASDKLFVVGDEGVDSKSCDQSAITQKPDVLNHSSTVLLGTGHSLQGGGGDLQNGRGGM